MNTGEVLLPFQAMRGWLCSDESALVLLQVNDESWQLESHLMDDFSIIESPEWMISLKETKFDGAGMLNAHQDVDQILQLLNEKFGGDRKLNIKRVCMNAAGCVLVLLKDESAYYFGKPSAFGLNDQAERFRSLFLESE